MTTVAVFPIPNCVAFPGQHFPLHVFEPRYRKLIDYCVENRIRVAVANVDKRIHQAKRRNDVADTAQNLDTYVPKKVVSAGYVDVVDRASDGRLAVVVHMDQRLELKSCQQMLPFLIYDAEAYEDECNDTPEQIEFIRMVVLGQLKQLFQSAAVPQGDDLIREFVELDAEQLSFRLFSIIDFEPSFMQDALEATSAQQRLTYVANFLSRMETVQ